MPNRLVSILLAAGASRRMGEPKLFLPLFGSTLLRLAAKAALDLTKEGWVVVVTGRYDLDIRNHLANNDRIVFAHNAEWDSGMASSLAAGISAAKALEPTHFLVTLADQPTMNAEKLALLTDESRRFPDQIIATHYPERLGVPAIFPVAFTEALSGGNGAFGARRLIAQEGDRVRPVTFPLPPVDVDTPEDYEKVKE